MLVKVGWEVYFIPSSESSPSISFLAVTAEHFKQYHIWPVLSPKRNTGCTWSGFNSPHVTHAFFTFSELWFPWPEYPCVPATRRTIGHGPGKTAWTHPSLDAKWVVAKRVSAWSRILRVVEDTLSSPSGCEIDVLHDGVLRTARLQCIEFVWYGLLAAPLRDWSRIYTVVLCSHFSLWKICCSSYEIQHDIRRSGLN